MLQCHIDFVESFYRSFNVWSPHLLPFDELASTVHAEFRFAPVKSHALLLKSGSVCKVDIRLDPPEQRVVAAHELAHVIMHYGNQVRMVRIFRVIQEGEASTLAGHIFAPDYLMEGYIQDAPPFYEAGISYLAYVFGVTFDAMRERLDEFHRKHAEKFAAAAHQGC
ncbi:MAG: ImmA/IrrE family metallo-endopeptidase [Alicyclobacillus sp.]|nr:ImmA/IrrE family metallo-endopeptidase [Alicyclobacillus sp.]